MLILAAGIAFLLKKTATVAHLQLKDMRNTAPAA
jgi:hypothetical protein